MPTTTDWFNLYTAQKTAITALNAAVTGVQGAIAIQINNALFDINATLLTLKPIATSGGGTTVAIDLTATNTILATTLGNVVPKLNQIVGAFAGIQAVLTKLDAGTLTGIELAIQQIGNNLFTLDAGTLTGIELAVQDIAGTLGTLDAGTMTGIELAIQRAADALERAAVIQPSPPGELGEPGASIVKLIDGLLGGSTAQAATIIGVSKDTLPPYILESTAAAKHANPEHAIQYLTEKMGVLIQSGLEAGRPILDLFEIPFKAIVDTALTQFQASLALPGAGTPAAARTVALNALGTAHAFGLAAHILALAPELVPWSKHLGFPEAAAAIADMAGFKGISQAVIESMLAGAISRPMHFDGNVTYTPELANPLQLQEFLRKREIDEGTYAYALQFWGYGQEDRDLFVRTAYRDPMIRDLAIAIEDTTVEETFIHSRVRRAGFSDDDADHLTAALMQRANKSSRSKVLSAANSAFADGVLSAADHSTVLDGLGLGPGAIALEQQAALINEQHDYVKQAIATYRKQYTNDVIKRADFALALSSLGLEAGRQSLELADADAQRAPKITREAAAGQATIEREIQQYLVPRYRELYMMGLVSAGDYQTTLESAGIDPSVASQTVALDTMKIRAVATRTANTLAEKTLTAAINSQEGLYTEQFRAGVIDESTLRASLSSLGLPAGRIDTIVGVEKARALPTIPRIIAPPPAAAAKIATDLAIQTALLDFRRGRIDGAALYAVLVRNGVTAVEAAARVDLEIARKPA